MRYLVAAVLSALLLGWANTDTPVNLNSSEAKEAVATEAQTVTSPKKAEPKAEIAQVEQPAPPAPEPQPEPAPVATPEPVIQTPVNDAKAFIYDKESGNDPTNRNYLGCFGIGQDCNGIVEPMCGTDYTCQDNYFTSYMLRRYGSWEAARSFWLARVPINGKDVGNWW